MGNPYSKLLINKKMQKGIESLKRLDDKGQLYYMDYTGNYYGLVGLPIKALSLVKKGGCSAFITKNPEGQCITCRNYDLAHMDDDGNCYGVDVIMHTHPAGKYRSIAGVDAVWLKYLGVKTKPGCIDDGESKLTSLVFLPYLCMDGMNEKGFSASILALDVKPGESPVRQNVAGKKKVILTVLLRYMLDSCANVEQAVAMAKSYNVVNTFGFDYHLFVSDASGKAAALEWRRNEFRAIRTDALTNCYVCEDDAEDCYYSTGLKEKWIAPDFEMAREYHFGYGHGYERLKTLIKTLSNKVNHDAEKYETCMTKDEARELLSKVAQDYNGMLTGFTQYSAIYNNSTLEVSYWLQQDYSKEYKFRV